MRPNHRLRWLWLAIAFLVFASVPNSFAGSFGTDGPAPAYVPPSSPPPQNFGTDSNSQFQTSVVPSPPPAYVSPTNTQPAPLSAQPTPPVATSQAQPLNNGSSAGAYNPPQSFGTTASPQPAGVPKEQYGTWRANSQQEGFSLMTPKAHQWDIEASDNYQFITSNSMVKRRINSERSAYIHLPSDLGNDQMQLPEVQITYWFNDESGAQLQSRYFAVYGDNYVTYPLGFGGATLAPNQTLSTKGTRWFTVGGYYVRRLTPLYENSQTELPRWLQGWDVRAKVGLEFSYLDFRINDGSPQFTGTSLFEGRMRFHDKGLPVPVIGMEARKWIAQKVALEVTAQGNWINKVNSGRSENGTVYDSQSGFETHWRLIYDNPELLHGVNPYGGINYTYYKYDQSGSGVENLIRVQMFGPELGLNYSL
jgi:hypothetical protein